MSSRAPWAECGVPDGVVEPAGAAGVGAAAPAATPALSSALGEGPPPSVALVVPTRPGPRVAGPDAAAPSAPSPLAALAGPSCDRPTPAWAAAPPGSEPRGPEAATRLCEERSRVAAAAAA